MTTPLSFASLQMIYQFVLQRVDSQDNILDTIPQSITATLPQGISGMTVHNLADGAVDVALPIIQDDFTDFVVLYSPSAALTVKIDGVGSTPLRLRSGGMILLDSSSILGVFASNSSGARAPLMFFQARRTALP